MYCSFEVCGKELITDCHLTGYMLYFSSWIKVILTQNGFAVWLHLLMSSDLWMYMRKVNCREADILINPRIFWNCLIYTNPVSFHSFSLPHLFLHIYIFIYFSISCADENLVARENECYKYIHEAYWAFIFITCCYWCLVGYSLKSTFISRLCLSLFSFAVKQHY